MESEHIQWFNDLYEKLKALGKVPVQKNPDSKLPK